MATFFVEVRQVNHQYANEQDVDTGLQWLFSNNSDERALLHEQQTNVVDMGCPGCRRREELGLDGWCTRCKLYACMLFAMWMSIFSVPVFAVLAILIYI